MQSVSSRIWTRVAVSISYDDNQFTTGISTKTYGIKCLGEIYKQVLLRDVLYELLLWFDGLLDSVMLRINFSENRSDFS